MKAVVVGGGIMGLCAAWALARKGHRAILIDKGPLPNPDGASNDRHRLIRYAYGAEDGYCRMVADAYGSWTRMWHDIGSRLYVETGTLVLSAGGGDWGEQSRASLERCHVPFNELPAMEAARRFPFLDADNLAAAYYMPSGGMLLASRICGALVAWLGRQRMDIRANSEAREIDAERGAVVLANGSRVEGDVVIVAAGPWSERLLTPLAGRVRPSRQVVIYMEPPPDLNASWQAAPMLLEIGADHGFYAVPPRAGLGLKVGDHRFTLAGNPDEPRIARGEDVQRVLSACRPRLRDFSRYRISESKVCFYDVAPEERFVVEPAGARAWVMAGFSGHGFKFASILGERLTSALEKGEEAATISRWAAGLP
jgi:glycine/D-amino acid oxidase-like deaminating enzyme